MDEGDRKKNRLYRRYWIIFLVAAALVTAVSSFSQAGLTRPLRLYVDDNGAVAATYNVSTNVSNVSFWGINNDYPRCEFQIGSGICINGSDGVNQGITLNGSAITGGSSNPYPTGINVTNGSTHTATIYLSNGATHSATFDDQNSGGGGGSGNVTSNNGTNGYWARFTNSTNVESASIICNAGFAISSLSNNSVCTQFVLPSRTINTVSPLSGGGTLGSDLTLSVVIPVANVTYFGTSQVSGASVQLNFSNGTILNATIGDNSVRLNFQNITSVPGFGFSNLTSVTVVNVTGLGTSQVSAATVQLNFSNGTIYNATIGSNSIRLDYANLTNVPGFGFSNLTNVPVVNLTSITQINNSGYTSVNYTFTNGTIWQLHIPDTSSGGLTGGVAGYPAVWSGSTSIVALGINSSMLNSTNSPSAGECLTYGSAGQFTWGSCGTGGGGGFNNLTIQLNGSTITTNTSAISFVGVGVNVTNVSGTAVVNITAPFIACNSGTASVATSSLTEVNFANCTIPAGILGANGGFSVEDTYKYTGTTNTKIMSMRFSTTKGDTTGGFQFQTNTDLATALTDTTTGRFVWNSNSQTAQVTHDCTARTFGQSTSTTCTGSINTTQTTYIMFNGRVTNAGDTIQLVGYRVIVYPGVPTP